MDSHATFVSDIFLCICTGSGFTMNLEWSQQMMRGSWLYLKSRLTEPLVTKSNSSEELIATLASTGMGNLKAVQILSVMMKLLSSSHAVFQGGRNNLFYIWKRLCCVYFCESLGMVTWALQDSSLDFCNSCSSGWMQKLPVADLAKSSQYHQKQIHGKWHLLLQSLSGKISCFWREVGKPAGAWDASALETLLTSSKYQNIHLSFSVTRQWYCFWVLTAKQVGMSTLSSKAMAATLCHF